MADNPLVAVYDQLQSRTAEFKHALPPQIPPERFIRVAMTALQINPELVAVDRRSLMNALMRSASDGLLPDGRQAAIVPFRDNKTQKHVATYIPMIAGLLARFRNSGQFGAVSCNVVRAGEHFKHWIDERGEHLEHEPGDDDRAPVVKAYAIAMTKDGGTAIRVMSREAIEKRRAVSRAKDGPLWREWFEEAAQKTVLRNLMKILPSSSDDIDRLIERDDDLEIDAPETPPRRRLDVASALEQFGGTEPSKSAAASEPVEQTAPEPPASEPPQNALKAARDLGAQHRREGVQRRAVPPQYREESRAAELAAWREGWDGAAES